MMKFEDTPSRSPDETKVSETGKKLFSQLAEDEARHRRFYKDLGQKPVLDKAYTVGDDYIEPTLGKDPAEKFGGEILTTILEDVDQHPDSFNGVLDVIATQNITRELKS